jgi:uncharacterized protein YnzC (UPF0291/DUF896 family)
MKMKIAGLTVHGIEESSVYQAILREGYREGFRACFAQIRQDAPGEETAGHLYEELRLKMKKMGRERLPATGLEEVPEYQAILREGYRDGFRACFTQTFKEAHGEADEETFEHLYEQAWRKALIAQLRQLVARYHPAFEFVGEAVRIRHLSELEKLWFDFNEIRGWMMLRERFGAFVAERK